MKLIEKIKKHKLHIMVVLLVIFFFRSCSKSSQVMKMEKVITNKETVIDSLRMVVLHQKDTITNFPNILNGEKIKIHSEYDNYISQKDRGEQLMGLHMIIKDNIKQLLK